MQNCFSANLISVRRFNILFSRLHLVDNADQLACAPRIIHGSVCISHYV